MLVSADSGGQDLRDVRVGDDREPVVDRAGAVGVPLIGYRAEGHGESEDPVLVVHQDLAEIARLHTAEAHGGAGGEPDGKDRGARVRAERNQPGAPADLYARFPELIREAGPFVSGGHEYIKVLLLQLEGDVGRDFLRRSGAEDGGKARCGAVHELHAPLPEDDVVCSAQPGMALVRIFGRQVEVRILDVADRLFTLLGEEGGHARIQARSQVGKMDLFLGHRRNQVLAFVENDLHVLELLDRKPGDSVDDRKVVAGVREGHFLVSTELVHRLFPLLLHPLVDRVGASDS